MEERGVPNQLDHIAMIASFNRQNRKDSEKLLANQKHDLKLLGTALNAIYQAASCHRKCWGPPHVLEMIGGRIYNLACAAYSLISIGYYDEALALIRGIGEAGNLVALSTENKTKFKEWLSSSKGERLKHFSPKKVRDMVGAGNPLLMMDDALYSDLSEAYTHITPMMAVNRHSEIERNIVGGIIQEAGLKKALEHLTQQVATVALLYCKYFELEDLFEELKTLARSSG